MEQNEQKKLKILMAIDNYLPDVDGVVNCMHNYCMHSLDRVDLTALAPKNKKSYHDNFPYKILRCVSMKVPLLKVYYGFPDSDAQFKKILNETDFDIIHIHSPFNMGKYCLKLARKKNKPIVATFHTNFRPIFQQTFQVESIAETAVKSLGAFYNKLDEIFVCSPVVEEQARSFGYKGKVTYLPFGTEFEKCENVDELKAEFNKDHKTTEDELIFLYVGRLMELKRVDFIIDCLKLLKDKGYKFKFYVVGKGMIEEELKKQVKELDMQDCVIFPGFVPREKMPSYYARANLFLFPSLYDNFGLVKVEAAAFSTPGLFIKDSAAAYGVTDNVNGYLCEDTKDAFCNRIIDAISDRKHLHEVGINASNDLYCSWQQATDKVMDRLEEIAKNYVPKKKRNTSAENKTKKIMKNAVIYRNNEKRYINAKKIKEKNLNRGKDKLSK